MLFPINLQNFIQFQHRCQNSCLWIFGTFVVPKRYMLSFLRQRHVLDIVAGVCSPFFFFLGKNDRHGRGHDWNTACKNKKCWKLENTVPPSHTNLLLLLLLLLLTAQDGIRPNLFLFCDIPLLPFYFVRVCLG